MIGDDVIDVMKKLDNEVATLDHGAYQIYPIVRHGEIYMAAADFKPCTQ